MLFSVKRSTLQKINLLIKLDTFFCDGAHLFNNLFPLLKGIVFVVRERESFFSKQRHISSTVFIHTSIQMFACRFVLKQHYEGCYISFKVDSLRTVFFSCKFSLQFIYFRDSVLQEQQQHKVVIILLQIFHILFLKQKGEIHMF